MFGHNGAKSRPARETRVEAGPRATPDRSAASTTLLTIVGQQARVEGKLEIANGNVTKIREQDAHPAARPVHLVEEMRQSAQK